MMELGLIGSHQTLRSRHGHDNEPGCAGENRCENSDDCLIGAQPAERIPGREEGREECKRGEK